MTEAAIKTNLSCNACGNVIRDISWESEPFLNTVMQDNEVIPVCPACNQYAEFTDDDPEPVSIPQGWQPMETAPKSGINGPEGIALSILAFCPKEFHGPNSSDDRIRIVWWEPFINGGCWYDDRDIKSSPPKPTHWMPLPRSPEIARKRFVVEAKQFDGSVDVYLKIVDWMKACGSTSALANEVRLTTPLMLIPSNMGMKVAHPGDWIIRDATGEFLPCRPDLFESTYEAA